MVSQSMEEHKKISPKNINCCVIVLSDTKYKNPEDDFSGEYIFNELKSKYNVDSKIIIPDEKKYLMDSIEHLTNNNIDVIITTGGTGLESRDITIETVEELFNKNIPGFGEIFRQKSYEELGSGALLSRATAGTYKNTAIFSMPGSINAVKLGMEIILDELPHVVNHTKK